MRIPLEFYEVLRNKINLSDVVRQKLSISRKGVEYIGLCPFHSEKTPSFTVNDIKKFYHCFGCAAHGDVVKFISTLDGLTYKDAAIKLANDYNIEIPKLDKEKEKLYEEEDEILLLLQKAADFFESQLSEAAVKYLHSRSIDSKLIKKFNIGFLPPGRRLIDFFTSQGVLLDKLVKAGLVSKKENNKLYEIFNNRIIFPIKNIYNKVIGFGGRVIDEGLPKYLNSPETILFKKGHVLYGENNALTAAYRKNYAILVEGYLDVITLYKAGFEETVASLGTAVSEYHIKTLWRYCDEIIVCLDGDNAGRRATKKIIGVILPLVTHEKTVSFIELPNGLDPHGCVVEKGTEYFSKILKSRITLSNMIWKIEYEGKHFLTAEDKATLTASLEKYCLSVQNRVLKYSYSRFFKDQIWHYLIKQKKTPSSSTTLPFLIESANHTEIELLEYGLSALLINFPNIIHNDIIKDFFYNINFKISQLEEFKEWFLEEFSDIKDLYQENILKKVESSRFYKIYILLLKNTSYLPVVYSDKNINYTLLWEILKKKYYLALLKEEYNSIMSLTNMEIDSFNKASSYSQEIVKITEEINHLVSTLLN